MKIHIFSSSVFHFKSKTYFFVMANVDLDASVESDILNISLDSGIPFELDVELEELEMEPPASPLDSGCTPTSGCFFYSLWFNANEALSRASYEYRQLYLANVALEAQLILCEEKRARRKEKKKLKRMVKTIEKAREIMAKW